ncbi:Six-hairpin glycosidase [Parasponia andersonii]|uniref:Six-hairpin glycosidase n=1 Tax=Parasponia andersonii TaxID=3476 RepID=A0A2P5D908_PARAD|nr:Six-hairpin glycosidase [Parasponia andersonii]
MKNFVAFELLVVFIVFVLSGFGTGKECTNVPTQLSSHSLRYELLLSKNETWRKEMFSHYHLTPTDESAWSELLPRKILREEDEFEWTMMYRKMKSSGDFDGPGNLLKEISLHDVRLNPASPHGRAQQTNLEYLLILDVDSLVWSFRKTAGLPNPGKPYAGWEDPTVELRGHFVGHYLSATAQMWASTHNDTLREKMSTVVSSLSECQEKLGTGYLSAFPSELFDRFEAIKPVWAPYYTIHKILAGLLDQYTLAGNDQALKMMTWMVDYFYNRVQNVVSKYTVERHYRSLNEETGGMNDVLYRLYNISANPKHLLLAHLFDKPCFLGLLAVQADDISGFHANTHIPIVIGSQLRYEITGDPLYKDVGIFFMDIVNSSHSYATGGTSVSEFWSEPRRLANTLQAENEESCTTYNMLKVSRHLFSWTKEVAYADYYERALTNGVLSIQRGTEPGVMIYMLPQGRGVSKAKSYHGWGTPFASFWCCYGTGVESFSKLGDSIYFEEKEAPGLYVIQYISSSLNWKLGNVVLNQKVDPVNSWDPYLRVTFTLKGTGKSSTLNLRVPSWTQSSGAKATLNAKDLSLPAPGNFLSITKNWSPSDVVTLQLPISTKTDPIKDDRPEYASIQAILYGPYLLAAHSSGDWDIKTGSDSSTNWITPIPSSYNDFLVSFFQEIQNSTFVLTNSNQSITMENVPESGTDSSLQATFRLVLPFSEHSTVKDDGIVGKSVMLEPFDFPGTVVVQRGEDLTVADSSIGEDSSSVFHLVSGLDGRTETISLESESKKGCFVYTANAAAGGRLKLSCNLQSSDAALNQAASFIISKGLSEYHPISFVAKGASRNFLLKPLFSFKDESYTFWCYIWVWSFRGVEIGNNGSQVGTFKEKAPKAIKDIRKFAQKAMGTNDVRVHM